MICPDLKFIIHTFDFYQQLYSYILLPQKHNGIRKSQQTGTLGRSAEYFRNLLIH